MCNRSKFVWSVLACVLILFLSLLYYRFLRDDSFATLRGEFGRLHHLAFSPDGESIAAGNTNTEKLQDGKIWNVGHVKIWDVRTKQERLVINTGNQSLNAIAFSPDGKHLALGGSGIWDAKSGKQLTYIPPDHFACYSPDGSLVASALENSIVFIDCLSGNRQSQLDGHTGKVESLAFSPHGRTLASCARDGTVRLWSTQSWQEIKILHGHSRAVTFVAFSSDGGTLASSGEDGTIRLWDVKNSNELRIMSSLSKYGPLAFSPDLKLVAAVDDIQTCVRMVSVESNRVVSTLRGHWRRIYSVAFSGDGNTLATCSGDGTVKLWDVGKLKQP